MYPKLANICNPVIFFETRQSERGCESLSSSATAAAFFDGALSYTRREFCFIELRLYIRIVSLNKLKFLSLRLAFTDYLLSTHLPSSLWWVHTQIRAVDSAVTRIPPFVLPPLVSPPTDVTHFVHPHSPLDKEASHLPCRQTTRHGTE